MEHVKIDCGLEIWDINPTHNPHISNNNVIRDLTMSTYLSGF